MAHKKNKKVEKIASIETLDKKVDHIAQAVHGFNKTIDNLARMTAQGFSEMATKHDAERLEIKFDNLDMKMSAYISNWEQDFSGLRKWVGDLDQRVRKMEQHRAK